MKSFAKLVTPAIGAILIVAMAAQVQGQAGRGRFVGADPSFLLRAPEVQKELKLADEQKEKLNELRTGQREAFRDLRKFENREEREKKQREIVAKFQADLKKALNEDQQKRLGQIMLQQLARVMLERALLGDDVSKRLEITEEQRSKIRTINRELREANRDLQAKVRETEDQKARRELFAKQGEVRKEAREKTLAVLTKEQKEQWTAMLGKPVEIRFGRRRGRRRDQ